MRHRDAGGRHVAIGGKDGGGGPALSQQALGGIQARER